MASDKVREAAEAVLRDADAHRLTLDAAGMPVTHSVQNRLLRALRAALDAPSGCDATPSAREIREACVKHVADAIAACYRRAWTSPDEMRGATGALKRLAVSMANLPLSPAPAASAPADDAVVRAVALARREQSRASKAIEAVRAILDRLPCHISGGDGHTKDQRGLCHVCSAKDALLAAERAAKGGDRG